MRLGIMFLLDLAMGYGGGYLLARRGFPLYLILLTIGMAAFGFNVLFLLVVEQ